MESQEKLFSLKTVPMHKKVKKPSPLFGLNLLALSVLFIFCLPGSVLAQESKNYIFATATTGGTYYPVGVAVATLTKIKLEPKDKISLSAISSAGSGENIKLLRENEAQFAILQGLYGAWAWNGKGEFRAQGAQNYLRSLTMLWQNVEHFAIQSDLVRSGDLSDMEMVVGNRFSIGKKNSGTEGSGRHILARLGFRPDKDFHLVNLDYGSSADALLNGTITGMNIPAGPPVSAVSRAFAALGKDVTLLSCTDEQLRLINRGYNLWSNYTIAAGTYPGQDQPITTLAQPNFMAVRNDVDDEAVYKIVKTIYSNLDFLHNIHQATRAMRLENGIAGLPIPLHPGAARFFREQGIDIPDHLIVE